MTVDEAIALYKKDKNKISLFENMERSNLKYSEIETVLKDTFKESIDTSEFATWHDEKIKKYISTEGTYFLSQEEWEQWDDV